MSQGKAFNNNVKREFARLVAEGTSVDQAARAVGITPRLGFMWQAKAKAEAAYRARTQPGGVVTATPSRATAVRGLEAWIPPPAPRPAPVATPSVSGAAQSEVDMRARGRKLAVAAASVVAADPKASASARMRAAVLLAGPEERRPRAAPQGSDSSEGEVGGGPVDLEQLALEVLRTARNDPDATPATRLRAAQAALEHLQNRAPPPPPPEPERLEVAWGMFSAAELDFWDFGEAMIRGAEVDATKRPYVLARAPERWGLDTAETAQLEELLRKVSARAGVSSAVS